MRAVDRRKLDAAERVRVFNESHAAPDPAFRGDAERLAAWPSATNVYGPAKRRPALGPPVPAPGIEQDVAA